MKVDRESLDMYHRDTYHMLSVPKLVISCKLPLHQKCIIMAYDSMPYVCRNDPKMKWWPHLKCATVMYSYPDLTHTFITSFSLSAGEKPVLGANSSLRFVSCSQKHSVHGLSHILSAIWTYLLHDQW